jgi:arylsulfatase A-like enzyme
MIGKSSFDPQYNKKYKLILMTLLALCGGAILTLMFRNPNKKSGIFDGQTAALNAVDEPYAFTTTSQHLRKLATADVKKTSPPSIVPTATPGKWNVVFYIFDDLGGVRIDPNINPNQMLHGKTPGFSKMAARSVVFPRTKTLVPLCGPSRIVELTSTIPQIFNFDSNWYQLYQTSIMGTLVKQGFKNVQVQGKVNHELPSPPSIREMQLLYHMNETTMPAGALAPGNSECGGFMFCSLKMAELADYTVVDNAIDFLDQMQKRPAEQQDEPWALFVGEHRPHTYYAVDSDFINFVPGDIPNLSVPTIEVPAGQYPLAFKQCNDEMDIKYGPGEFILNKKRPMASDICQDLPLTKLIRKSYQNAVAWADSMLNRFLIALDNSDYADNTMIVMTADHGFNLGEGCLWCKGLLDDEATIIPLMISIPGVPAGIAPTLVNSWDIAPTIYEVLFGKQFVANFRHPSGEALAGQSLVPALYNNDVQINSVIFSQYGRCQPPNQVITMPCSNDLTKGNEVTIPCSRPPLLYMGYEATTFVVSNGSNLECRYVAWWHYVEEDVCEFPSWANQPPELKGYGSLSNQVIFSKSGTVWGSGASASIPGHKELYCHPAGALYGDPGYPNVNNLANNPTAANAALMAKLEAAIVSRFKPTTAPTPMRL